MGWQDDEVVGGKAFWEDDEVVGSAQGITQPQQPIPLITADKKKKKTEMIGPYEAIVEPAMAMGSGFLSSAVAGYKGMYDLVRDGVTGKIAEKGLDASLEKAGKDIKGIQEKYTYQPRSTAGKVVTEAAAWPFQKAGEGYEFLGGLAGNALGDEEAGKAIGKGGFDMTATVLGGLKGKSRYEAAPATEASLMNQLAGVTQEGLVKASGQFGKKKSGYKNITNQTILDAEAIKSILKDKDVIEYQDTYGQVYDKGRIPETANELLQAHWKRKQNVLEEAEALNAKAGEAGATTPLDRLVTALDDFATKNTNVDNAKGAVAYANRLKKTFEERGSYTPKEAQDAMKIYNDKARDQGRPASLTSVDEIVANILREDLNTTVETHGGVGYEKVRKELGALISSENRISTAMLRASKKGSPSATEYADVFGISTILRGIAQGDPIAIAKGAGLGIVSERIRMGKDPDFILKNMMKKADKIVEQMKGLIPEEKAAAIAEEFEAASPGFRNQLSLPAPTGEISAYQRIVDIAQTPGGMEFLTEKLGRTKGDAEMLKVIKNAAEGTSMINYPLQTVPNTNVYHIPKTNALGQ